MIIIILYNSQKAELSRRESKILTEQTGVQVGDEWMFCYLGVCLCLLCVVVWQNKPSFQNCYQVIEKQTIKQAYSGFFLTADRELV